MRPRPRPWRARCPVCRYRSTGGYETGWEAQSVAEWHLEVRHGLTLAEVERMMQVPVSLTEYRGESA